LDLSLYGEEHVHAYLDSKGEVGHVWNGVPTLVLTTVGRRSGKRRRHAMIYGQHDGCYVVIASQGGAPTHPNWYINLCADPHVHLHVGHEDFDAVARTAEGDERAVLWTLMTELWPSFDIYQQRTARRIPVVALDPKADPT
jgi:deazaflavin-dependent oxidoreductase (nitroreductase family)